MTTRKKNLAILALAVSASAMAAAPAQAQNTTYAPGDLVLYFQNPGGTTGADQTVYVNLGNTATLFRQGGVGTAGATNLLNIVNISSTLISAFGANWASELTLYAGLAGTWSSSPGTTLQNGDPARTLYVSQSRASGGIAGQAGSTGYSILGNTAMTTGAGRIIGQNNVLETDFTGTVGISSLGNSGIDDQNPFTIPGVQGTAFATFAGGVQQQGSATSFGAFGPVTGVEYALDLYRILAATGVTGQVDGPLREGTFEGTVVLDNAGNVSFVAVPEPSTAALLGAAVGIAGFVRRRRTA